MPGGIGQVRALALPVTAIRDAMLRQRGHLFVWVPVCLGVGIGTYFALPVEPGVRAAGAAVVGAVALCGLLALAGEAWRPLVAALLLALIGLTLAAARSQSVAAPVLGWRFYGPIEGRVIEVDRSGSDAVRLTLDRVRLDDLSPDRTPARVRVSLHGDWPERGFMPGMRVMTTGHLSPPGGPVEPGGFDFRRTAWFEGLGAVGYTRNPVLVAAPAEDGAAGLFVHRWRLAISTALRARIGGDAGGFAAAVTTGDRSGLAQDTRQSLRDSNTFHLVSISGMHMGMVAAFVFGLVRAGVAAIPPLALRVPARKVAALAALPAAAFYLALAGRAIPTERAFVMVAVMLVAVLFDRRALSMRSVALAATVVLVLRPESLINAGFQMSFAAVVALIFVFGALPGGVAAGSARGWTWRVVGPVAMLLLSSLVAGSATAPLAAAHFNRVAHYGLLANLLAVPAMGLLVMPGAVLAALLAPLGLDRPALWMMEAGSRWILEVADRVAALDGAISAVPSPPDAVVPMLALGALFVVLWQGRARLAGLAPVAAAFAIWLQAERPPLLVAESGGLVGLMTDDGRALSKATGDGFAADRWLESDGSVTGQEVAAALGVLSPLDRTLRIDLPGLRVVQTSGKGALAALDGCGGADVLIATVEVDTALPCDVYDVIRLRETGSLAVIRNAERGLTLVSARDLAGERLWTGGN